MKTFFFVLAVMLVMCTGLSVVIGAFWLAGLTGALSALSFYVYHDIN